MKKLALLMIPFALLMADDQKIPAGAKKVEPYLYRYTDAQGKKWFYRESPFGVVKWEDRWEDKWEDKAAAATPAVDDAALVQVTDLGDSVQFKRKTPFGEQKWVRPKTELTDEEKAMLQRDAKKTSETR